MAELAVSISRTSRRKCAGSSYRTTPRLILSDHANDDGERLIYDLNRGRGESIGTIDEEYVPLFERFFAELLKCY